MIHTRIADRYVLLAPIGSGGEARVFRARDEAHGIDVAVRLAIGDVTSVQSSSTAISSERWVRFLDSGMDTQHGAYQVFELLEGPTYGSLVAELPMPAPEWRKFVDQSLEAVEAIHLAGWIHGDLNADNFMLTVFGWKLLELPFYRFHASAGRSTMFGSIFTLAPEQIDGAGPSVRSDIYSLGCLYYFGAAVRWPHSGTRVQEIAIERLMHDPPPLRDLAPRLPEAASDWVMTLLARRPEERPPSIAAARQLLADAVA
jgi:serine/threonine protein kinase